MPLRLYNVRWFLVSSIYANVKKRFLMTKLSPSLESMLASFLSGLWPPKEFKCKEEAGVEESSCNEKGDRTEKRTCYLRKLLNEKSESGVLKHDAALFDRIEADYFEVVLGHVKTDLVLKGKVSSLLGDGERSSAAILADISRDAWFIKKRVGLSRSLLDSLISDLRRKTEGSFYWFYRKVQHMLSDHRPARLYCGGQCYGAEGLGDELRKESVAHLLGSIALPAGAPAYTELLKEDDAGKLSLRWAGLRPLIDSFEAQVEGLRTGKSVFEIREFCSWLCRFYPILQSEACECDLVWVGEDGDEQDGLDSHEGFLQSEQDIAEGEELAAVWADGSLDIEEKIGMLRNSELIDPDTEMLFDVFLKVCEDFDARTGRKARMKEVFILSECGYDCKALAEAYGVSLATVYNRLNDGEAIIDKRLSETRLKGDAKASSRLRRLFWACNDLPSASLEKLGDPERNDHDKYSYLEEMSDEK